MLKEIDNISINCQSSIKISDGLTIYFDPYDIKEKVSNADYIFITHPHWDHLDIDSINNIANEKTIIVGPSSVIEKLDKSFNLLEVEPNKTYNLNNISFKTVPSYNIERDYHPKEARYVGYLLTLNDITYYVPGDTDVIEELKELNADVIFLPVGGTYTMNREEAINDVKDAWEGIDQTLPDEDKAEQLEDELQKEDPNSSAEYNPDTGNIEIDHGD